MSERRPQRVKCIGTAGEAGAMGIQERINSWIRQKEADDKREVFVVQSISVAVARTFTMATILYRE